jgi:1-acyl-sn-glycerol-3-phosphate acyltransferase
VRLVTGQVKGQEPDGRMVAHHRVQRALGWLIAPVWVPLAVLVLRIHFGYRIEHLAKVRREAQRIRRESGGPLLICANHLTLIDSMLVAWALAPTWRYLTNFDLLPWNTPEVKNFANTTRNKIMVYLAKCVPIERGGDRESVARVLDRMAYLLRRGEQALVFPEGGRSRSGRVAPDAAAWGVGRMVGAVPGCRVLCVYLRGAAQESWSDYPAKGDRIEVSLACIEPKSDHRGVRRSRDIAQQIVSQLIRMEESYFDGRQ